MLNLPTDGKAKAATIASTKPSAIVPLIEVNGFIIFSSIVKSYNYK
jgi:hypothetical protein